MDLPIWGSTLVGLGLGGILAYLAGRQWLLKLVLESESPGVLARFGVAGIVIFFVPALLLAIVAGGTLGGSAGDWLFGKIGMPVSGVPLGLGLGTAIVFALVLAGGTALSVLAGRALLRYARGSRRD